MTTKINLPVHPYLRDAVGDYLHPRSDDDRKLNFEDKAGTDPEILWVHIPDDPTAAAWDQFYFVCNYESGHILRQRGPTEHPGHHLHHDRPRDLDANDGRWLLQRAPVEPDVVNLRMKSNGFVARKPGDVKMTDDPTRDDVIRMRVWSPDAPKLPIPTLRGAEQRPGDTSDVPSTTQVDVPPLSPTPQRLLGEQYVPYFAVKDTDRDPSWQVKNSPVYVLSRYQRWAIGDMVVFDQEDPRAEYTAEWDVGYSQSEQESMTETANLSINAEFDLAFGSFFSMKWQAQIGFSVQVQTSRSFTTSSVVKKSLKIPNPSKKASRHVLWQLINVYELTRADGSLVKSWQIKLDGFPVLKGSPT